MVMGLWFTLRTVRFVSKKKAWGSSEMLLCCKLSVCMPAHTDIERGSDEMELKLASSVCRLRSAPSCFGRSDSVLFDTFSVLREDRFSSWLGSLLNALRDRFSVCNTVRFWKVLGREFRWLLPSSSRVRDDINTPESSVFLSSASCHIIRPTWNNHMHQKL